MLKENFIEFFEKSFSDNWEKIALSDYFKEDEFSYSELAIEVAKLHMLFDEYKIKKGDKIALIGRNNTRWCISYIAVVSYGAVIVPILQDFNANDVHHIINHSESVLIFAGDQHWDSIDPETVEKIRAAFSLTDFRCLYEKHGDTANHFQKKITTEFKKRYPDGFRKEDIKYAKVPNSDVVVLNYTSGTTGFSKGVMLTGNNLVGNILFGIKAKLHHPGSKALSFLPLAHAFGCTFDFLYPLCVGAHITLLGKIPSPKVLVEAFASIKPYLVISVPLIIEKIYKKQIAPVLERKVIKLALKIPLLNEKIHEKINQKLIASFGGEFVQVIIGGAPLNKEVEEFLLKIKFPFTVGYGMTECAPLISYTPHYEFIPYSCGKAIEGTMTARIDSPDPKNIPGEIIVKGENVMAGYYKNKEATDEIFTNDGWLRTGDIGTMDSNGTLFIRGRSKSVILSSNGQNIYPEEIESKLNNMHCVMESLVIDKDKKLVALVYPDYDQVDAARISIEHLKDIMEQNKELLNSLLAPYERIYEIVLFPTEFEKTPKKSIKRYLYNI